jgi:BMFP domain-containing protein YqiC
MGMDEREFQALLDRYAKNEGFIRLSDMEDAVKRIIEELRGAVQQNAAEMEKIRDQFIQVLNTLAKIVCKQDAQGIAEALWKVLENGEQGHNKKKSIRGMGS